MQVRTSNFVSPIHRNAVKYIIEGGHPLHGEVSAQSAKNAFGKQLVASLLTDEPCTFYNVPRITETDAILDMLREVGTTFEWVEEKTLIVQTKTVTNSTVGQLYSAFNRIPILMIAPLLHRAGRASVPAVGGCRIGARPVDFHINLLVSMGAHIEVSDEGYHASTKRLHGTTITLPYPSVGATENAIAAATVAAGTTVIYNAAVEPEIIDTILFLQKMGALIQIDVDRKIIIEGVERLHGATHRPMPDRIEVASFAVAAAATGGRVTVRNAQQEHMVTFLNTFRKAGGGIDVTLDGITFYKAEKNLRPVHIETDVHPGFMTDWQQPLVILLTQASGISIVHETVYEDRFGYTEMLRQMGASIHLSTACMGSKQCRWKDHDYLHSCVIQGPSKLRGTTISIPDLRAGFAYLTAALVAEGQTEVRAIKYIDRGYEHVPDKLRALGATLKIVDDEDVFPELPPKAG